MLGLYVDCVWNSHPCHPVCQFVPATLRLVLRYHLSLSLSLCHMNLISTITFYHPQHKPDKICPCLSASLLAAIITHCGSDIELAHSSGHAAPLTMCPLSAHPLHQQCEGVKCKARVEFRIAISLCVLIQIILLMITCHYFINCCRHWKLTGCWVMHFHKDTM